MTEFHKKALSTNHEAAEIISKPKCRFSYFKNSFIVIRISDLIEQSKLKTQHF
jgi:hypothetical protein